MGQKMALCNKHKRKKSWVSNNDDISIPKEEFPMNFLIISKKFWAEELRIEDMYLEINFFNQTIIKTKTIMHTNSPFWLVYNKFQYVANTLEDLQRELVIKLLDYKGKFQGEIRVPFFQLAMGSARNCFVFNSKKKYLGKLFFEIKISQRINISVDLQRISVQIYDIFKFFKLEDYENIRYQIFVDKNQEKNTTDYQFQQYSKSIYEKNDSKVKRHIFQWQSRNFREKLYEIQSLDLDDENDDNQSLQDEIVLNQEKNEKENFKIDIDNVENIFYTNDKHRESICNNPNKKYNRLISQGFSMEFDMEIQQLDKKVHLDLNLHVKDLHDSHIVIKIYNPKSKNYFATGYISIDQFYLHKGNLIQKNMDYLNFSHVNIWKYGHFVGQADIFIKLKYPCFLRQSKIGIQTEEKVHFDDVKSDKKVTENEFVKNINYYNEEIKELIFSVNQQIESNVSLEEIQPNIFASTFSDKLEEMLNKPSNFFDHKADMYQLQVSLIDLIISLLKFYKEIELEKQAKQKTVYCIKKLLQSDLLNRELLRDSESNDIKIFFEKAGMKKLNEQNFFTNQSLVQFNQKKNVQTEYLKLFDKILHYIISKIHVDEHDYQEMELISFLLVHFYLRLRIFQKNFIIHLKQVLKDKGVRFQNYSFDGAKIQQKQSDSFQKNFFYMLTNEDNPNQKLDDFYKQLENPEIYHILMGKQIYLTNLFLTKLLQNYNDQVIQQKFTWDNLPGYNTLMHFIYYQVSEQTNIVKMEEQNLLETVQAVMLNNLQLHIFLPLIIMKTDLNQQDQVQTLFEIMANKFNSLIQQKTFKKLNIEFNLLLKLFINIFESDSLLNCEYALLFLYKFIWLLGNNFKNSFWCIIESNIFYQYFLHWSFTIRKVFCYLMIFHFYYDQQFSNKLKQKFQILGKSVKEYENFIQKNRGICLKPKDYESLKENSKEINPKFYVYIKTSFETFHQVHQIYLAYLNEQQSSNGNSYFQNSNKLINTQNKDFDYQNLPQISPKLLKDNREFKNPKQLINQKLINQKMSSLFKNPL